MISCFWQNAEIFHTDIKKKKTFKRIAYLRVPRRTPLHTEQERTATSCCFFTVANQCDENCKIPEYLWPSILNSPARAIKSLFEMFDSCLNMFCKLK